MLQSAGAISATVKHDVQGDAAAITAMGLGTPRVAPTAPLDHWRRKLREEARFRRKRVAHRYILGCQREVSTPVSFFVPRSRLIGVL